MTPEVTAAERAAAQEIIREALGTNPAVLAVLEAKADSWVHRLIPAVATALATVRAEGADVVLERDELLNVKPAPFSARWRDNYDYNSAGSRSYRTAV